MTPPTVDIPPPWLMAKYIKYSSVSCVGSHSWLACGGGNGVSSTVSGLLAKALARRSPRLPSVRRLAFFFSLLSAVKNEREMLQITLITIVIILVNYNGIIIKN